MHYRLILRWGTWLCYSEWRPDQPHEDWSGSLSAHGGNLYNPRQLLYHGCWGAQHRVARGRGDLGADSNALASIFLSAF